MVVDHRLMRQRLHLRDQRMGRRGRARACAVASHALLFRRGEEARVRVGLVCAVRNQLEMLSCVVCCCASGRGCGGCFGSCSFLGGCQH